VTGRRATTPALDRRIGGRLLQPEPQIQPDHPEGQRHQERQPPSPRFQRALWQQPGQHRCRTDAAARAEPDGPPQPGAVPAAPAFRRVLDGERGGVGRLPTQRQALRQPEQDQQDRREQADAGVAREQADADGGQRHQDDHGGKHLPAAEPVAAAAEQHRTHGTGSKGDGEHREGCQQAGGVIGAGKVGAGQDRGEGAEDREVVPLDQVVDAGGDQRPAGGRPPHRSVLPPQGLAASAMLGRDAVPTIACSRAGTAAWSSSRAIADSAHSFMAPPRGGTLDGDQDRFQQVDDPGITRQGYIAVG